MTDNATFHTFRPSGKWYATGRGVCPESAFNPMLAHHERRAPILVTNDRRMLGLSGDGDGYDVVVVLDDAVNFGWPLMLRARS